MMPESAQQLHEMGRALGSRGEFEKSIDLFKKAHALDPQWPYPVYDLAYAYLLQQDFDNALRYYELTDSLAPDGFYTSKTAVDTLRREASGEFPRGTYFAYMQMEWARNQDEKLEILQLLTEKIPHFAPAWKELSSLLLDSSERMKAIDRGLQCDADVQTKGMLLLNKALLLNTMGERAAAKMILDDLLASADTPKGVKALARFSSGTVP